MSKKKRNFGFSATREILRSAGVVLAVQTPVPVDKERAKKEQEFEKKFGYSALGIRIPNKYFDIFPDDSQAKLEFST